MTIDIQKLKALAEEAGPNEPWYESGDLRYADDKTGEIHGLDHHADEFIATASPAAVLDLIAERDVYRAVLEGAGYSQLDNMVKLGPDYARRIGSAAASLTMCIQQERDRLVEEIARLGRFETAYKEFSDKTDWVRPNASAHELGMHVADILHKRCDDLTSHNQAQADEIVRLRAIETFEDAVACVFDNLKYSAANTDDKAWDERLEDLAEDVIEYAPRYKKQWKDIIKLSRDKDSLQAENDALRKDAGRYRWLQRQVENCEWMAGTSTIADKFGSVSEERVSGAEDLDQTIDTAMAQEQQP